MMSLHTDLCIDFWLNDMKFLLNASENQSAVLFGRSGVEQAELQTHS